MIKSRLSIITAAILLAFSFAGIATFVQLTEADDYTLVVHHYNIYKCGT